MTQPVGRKTWQLKPEPPAPPSRPRVRSSPPLQSYQPPGLTKMIEHLAAGPSATASRGTGGASVAVRRTALGRDSAIGTAQAIPATQVAAALTPAQRGWATAAILLGQCPDALGRGLDTWAERGLNNGLDRALALQCAGYPEGARVHEIGRRLAALVDLLERPRSRLPAPGLEALAALQALEPSISASYSPPRSSRDGSVENHAFELLALSNPRLAREVALHHPQIPAAADLPATRAMAERCRREFGRFLGDFNVFTCMHIMGRTPGFLSVLSDELGMCKEDYLGYSVAYSDSVVSRTRCGIDGFETRSYGHPELAYVERCKVALREGLLEMDRRSRDNGKPILIVDDTGYAAEVACELGIAERCRIVGWTKRTSWLFDAGEKPGCAFLQAGESAPKVQWEPPLLAPGMAEHVSRVLEECFVDPHRAIVGVVGQGDVGAHLTAELAARGHRVVAFDRDVGACYRVRHRNLHHELDPVAFAAATDLFVGATGAGGLGGDAMRHAKPSAVRLSVSSSNAEDDSREQVTDGWNRDAQRVKIEIGKTSPRSNRREAAELNAWERAFRDSMGRTLGAQLPMNVGFSTSIRSSYVGNLTGRCRENELEAEELILMNVTRAMAEVSQTPAGESRAMSHAGSAAIFELYTTHHPEFAARAQRKSIPRSTRRHAPHRSPPSWWPTA